MGKGFSAHGVDMMNIVDSPRWFVTGIGPSWNLFFIWDGIRTHWPSFFDVPLLLEELG